jgi:hypothetical protein
VDGLLRRSDGDKETILSKDVKELVAVMSARRQGVPDKPDELSSIDAVLLPLIELRRVVALAQPYEEQMVHTEADILAYGITRLDLAWLDLIWLRLRLSWVASIWHSRTGCLPNGG